MPELYVEEADALEVEEASPFDDLALEVSEEDVMAADTPEAVIIVEEPDDIVPGSDARVQTVEQKADVPKEKDWVNDKDHSKFPSYLESKLKNVPRHNGENIPGCERAKHYIKECQRELSQAMRSDTQGRLDDIWADQQNKKMNDMIHRLDQQMEYLKSKDVLPKAASVETRLIAEGTCSACNSVAPMWHDTDGDRLVCLHCNADLTSDEGTLSKVATTPVLNVYMTGFERAIVATMINSSVSAGKNIEDTYMLLKNKYNFTPREELAIQQLVADYGYPVFKDRGRLNEAADPAEGNGVDWATNYHA